ncbi:hypothetical protein HanIR_Chr08g0378861 [Helianthus annuus]|nr:hypothetical protein HanIR_Chr08g0378861 [Helianthus annuus]
MKGETKYKLNLENNSQVHCGIFSLKGKPVVRHENSTKENDYLFFFTECPGIINLSSKLQFGSLLCNFSVSNSQQNAKLERTYHTARHRNDRSETPNHRFK